MGELNFDEIHNFVATDLMKPRSFSALHTSSGLYFHIMNIYELLPNLPKATDMYYGIRFKHYNAHDNFH